MDAKNIRAWCGKWETGRPKEISNATEAALLRVGRVSVAIRRLVHSSWYGPAGERPSWAGTSWTGTAGQGQVQLDRGRHSWTGTSYSHETGSRPTGFSYVYKYLLVSQ